MNQIAYQYLVPVINVGVRIAVGSTGTEGATGAVDILRPDLPCLWCKQFLNAKRIAADSMFRADRQLLEREGCVEGLETEQPAVIGITTAVAGHAVTLFLHLMTGFMSAHSDLQCLRWDVMSGTVNRGRTRTDDACVCGKARGFGDLAPMPTLA